jgi:hypothetical protein
MPSEFQKCFKTVPTYIFIRMGVRAAVFSVSRTHPAASTSIDAEATERTDYSSHLIRLFEQEAKLVVVALLPLVPYFW